eukprot:gnl/MRDRNA2_/MRDRNA2_59496_c0_seq1.p1 gnl/MRDRNA2_/MRDRNA2_59496_c0~~gnl/MRDRNA2_/MRDRNA2_59496_c0_seq1.p1  ORF type:complete len:392 (+),score=97.07 gnl/MRDRNA2_/MRDRNA2_59496_c0_seq1:84-1259(+)
MHFSFNAVVTCTIWVVSAAVSGTVNQKGQLELLRKEAVDRSSYDAPPGMVWVPGQGYVFTTTTIPPLEEEELKPFWEYDLDGSGYIEKNEIPPFVEDLNMTEVTQGFSWRRFDSDKDGRISPAEYDDLKRWYETSKAPLRIRTSPGNAPMIPPKFHHAYGGPFHNHDSADPPGAHTGPATHISQSLLQDADEDDDMDDFASAKDDNAYINKLAALEKENEVDDTADEDAQGQDISTPITPVYDFNTFFHHHAGHVDPDSAYLKAHKAPADDALDSFKIGSIMDAPDDLHTAAVNPAALLSLSAQSSNQKDPSQGAAAAALANFQIGNIIDGPANTVNPVSGGRSVGSSNTGGLNALAALPSAGSSSSSSSNDGLKALAALQGLQVCKVQMQ